LLLTFAGGHAATAKTPFDQAQVDDGYTDNSELLHHDDKS